MPPYRSGYVFGGAHCKKLRGHTRYPAATLPESGSLPAGVKFTNNKNGDGDHCGHPILNANKTYTITLKAADAGRTVTEKLTLTPQEAGAPDPAPYLRAGLTGIPGPPGRWSPSTARRRSSSSPSTAVASRFLSW
jgi:hypothetical protein